VFAASGPNAVNAGNWFEWTAVSLVAIAGAAIYALVLAFAANWAGQKKMGLIRWLILSYAWVQAAVFVVGAVLSLLPWPSLLAAAASIWILLTKVEKPASGA